jgi:hypothetical protein
VCLVALPSPDIPNPAEIFVFVRPAYESGHCPPGPKTASRPCPHAKSKSGFSSQLGRTEPKKKSPRVPPPEPPRGILSPRTSPTKIPPDSSFLPHRRPHRLSPTKLPPCLHTPADQAPAPPPLSRRPRPRPASSRRHPGHLLAAPWPSPRSAKTRRYGRRPPSPGRAPTAARTRCIHAPPGRRAPTARAESSDGQGGKPATLASSIRWP